MKTLYLNDCLHFTLNENTWTISLSNAQIREIIALSATDQYKIVNTKTGNYIVVSNGIKYNPKFISVFNSNDIEQYKVECILE